MNKAVLSLELSISVYYCNLTLSSDWVGIFSIIEPSAANSKPVSHNEPSSWYRVEPSRLMMLSARTFLKLTESKTESTASTSD